MMSVMTMHPQHAQSCPFLRLIEGKIRTVAIIVPGTHRSSALSKHTGSNRGWSIPCLMVPPCSCSCNERHESRVGKVAAQGMRRRKLLYSERNKKQERKQDTFSRDSAFLAPVTAFNFYTAQIVDLPLSKRPEPSMPRDQSISCRRKRVRKKKLRRLSTAPRLSLPIVVP